MNEPPASLGRLALRALRSLASGMLAVLILFEEWGWEPLQRAIAWLTRLPWLRNVEVWITTLPPQAALLIMCVPSLVLLLPTKLAALWLLAHGHALLGATVVVLAKVVGTAIVARLFALTRPALLRMPWFASAYTRWVNWKDALLARVRASRIWRAGRALKRAARRQWVRMKAHLGR